MRSPRPPQPRFSEDVLATLPDYILAFGSMMVVPTEGQFGVRADSIEIIATKLR